MYKIAVMGDRDSVYGFASLGLDIYTTDEMESAARTLRHLSENGYAVIFITEALAGELAQEIGELRSRKLPAVIPIPGVSGNTGLGMKNVRKFVEQAVGSDIIFNDKNEKAGTGQ